MTNLEKDSSYSSEFYEAVKGDNVTQFKLYITEDTIHLNKFLSEKVQLAAIHVASQHGSVGIVQYILSQRDTDINIQDGMEMWAPLHYASKHCQIGVLRLLLSDARIIPNIQDKHCRIPLHYAAQSGCKQAVILLLQRARSSGAVNACDINQWTPLHYASHNGHSEVIRILLRGYYADPYLRNELNKTALNVAVDKKDRNSLQVILDTPGVDLENFSLSFEEVDHVLRGPSHLTPGSPLPDRQKVTAALEEKLPVNHARVLVFGPEGTGKTCLVETLVGAEFRHTSPTDGADQMEISIQQTDDWELMSTDQKIKELEAQLKAEIFRSVSHSSSETVNTLSEVVPSSSRHVQPVALPTPTATRPVPLEVDKIMKLLEERKLYNHTRNYITIWDFAGQQVFHQTHGLFVSEEVVCVIVFNAAKPLDSIPVNRYPSDTLNTPKQSVIKEICYWMQLISVRVSKQSSCDGDSSFLLPTYILVGTHIDELHNDIQVASEIAYKIFAPIFKEELSKMPFVNHIAGSKTGQLFEKSSLFFVSNLKRDMKVITTLKRTIIEAASIMKQTRPIKYVNLERKLLFLSHFDRTSVIKKKEIESIAKDCGVPSNQELSEVLRHFHQRGLLLHYNQIPSLSDLVILSPQWLAKLLTYVITTLNCRPVGQPLYKFSEKLRREGLLEQKLLQWSVEQFVKKENTIDITYEQVVDLLLKFKLISDVTVSSIAGRQERTAKNRLFLVPHLLPIKEPLQPTSDTFFKILYHFSNEFIPDNFINELVVMCAKWSHQHSYKLKRLSYQCIWISYGKNQTICLRSVHDKCVIELTIVQASNLSSEEVFEAYIESQNLIGTIKNFIDYLMKQYMPAVCDDLPVECYAPCPNCDGFCIPLDNLKQTSSFYCESTNKYVMREDYHAMLTAAFLLSPSKVAFAVTKENAIKVLRNNFVTLETCLPVNDILGKLYTQNIITEYQKEEISSLAGKPTERRKLADCVICSVKMDEWNFGKFCNILKSIPATKSFGEKLWKDALMGELMTVNSESHNPLAV